MEMPHHLQALPPGAIEILRYFGTLDEPVAHANDIIDDTGLSDRGFGKAIRRLVTKQYLTMDGDQVYRLVQRGAAALQELAEVDASGLGMPSAASTITAKTVERRLMLGCPGQPVSGQEMTVYIGFDDIEDEQDILNGPVNVLVRLAALNARPETQEELMQVENRAAHIAFTVTPAPVSQMRLRVEVFHLHDDTGEVEFIGGLYVDVALQPAGSPADPALNAYTATLSLTA